MHRFKVSELDHHRPCDCLPRLDRVNEARRSHRSYPKLCATKARSKLRKEIGIGQFTSPSLGNQKRITSVVSGGLPSLGKR